MAIRRGEYDYLLPTRAGEALTRPPAVRQRLADPAWNGASSGAREDGATVVRGRWDLIASNEQRPRAPPCCPSFGVYEQAIVAAGALPADD